MEKNPNESIEVVVFDTRKDEQTLAQLLEAQHFDAGDLTSGQRIRKLSDGLGGYGVERHPTGTPGRLRIVNNQIWTKKGTYIDMPGEPTDLFVRDFLFAERVSHICGIAHLTRHDATTRTERLTMEEYKLNYQTTFELFNTKK